MFKFWRNVFVVRSRNSGKKNPTQTSKLDNRNAGRNSNFKNTYSDKFLKNFSLKNGIFNKHWVEENGEIQS